MKAVRSVPEPECPLGYPVDQLETFIPDMADLNRWMSGQTGAICDGRRYSYERGEWEPDACADSPHGMVVYAWDVERYLQRLPVVD